MNAATSLFCSLAICLAFGCAHKRSFAPDFSTDEVPGGVFLQISDVPLTTEVPGITVKAFEPWSYLLGLLVDQGANFFEREKMKFTATYAAEAVVAGSVAPRNKQDEELLGTFTLKRLARRDDLDFTDPDRPAMEFSFQMRELQVPRKKYGPITAQSVKRTSSGAFYLVPTKFQVNLAKAKVDPKRAKMDVTVKVTIKLSITASGDEDARDYTFTAPMTFKNYDLETHEPVPDTELQKAAVGPFMLPHELLLDNAAATTTTRPAGSNTAALVPVCTYHATVEVVEVDSGIADDVLGWLEKILKDNKSKIVDLVKEDKKKDDNNK
jgi:hypothetical protein